MIPIPEHLKENAINTKYTKTNIQFDFVCDCNNKEFEKAFKGSWTYTMESDEKGIVHYYRLYTPLGMYGPKKEVFPPETPPFAELKVIKAKCTHFKQKGNSSLGVIIKIENDGSLGEFIETTGVECDEVFYSNAFGSISIYTVNSEGTTLIPILSIEIKVVWIFIV